MPRDAFSSDELTAPVGPFSPGVRAGALLFLSGQIALSPKTGQLITAAGKSLADVARVNVYLTDMRDFARMNAVYARHFEAPYPARTTVAVSALPLGAAVEIDLIAQ